MEFGLKGTARSQWEPAALVEQPIGGGVGGSAGSRTAVQSRVCAGSEEAWPRGATLWLLSLKFGVETPRVCSSGDEEKTAAARFKQDERFYVGVSHKEKAQTSLEHDETCSCLLTWVTEASLFSSFMHFRETSEVVYHPDMLPTTQLTHIQVHIILFN